MSETIHHPPHYGGDTTYEAIKVIEAWELNFLIGNTVKYLCRAGKKPGQSPLQDLEKAAWYLARQIEQVKAAELGLKGRTSSSSPSSLSVSPQQRSEGNSSEARTQSSPEHTESATPSTSQERKSPSSQEKMQEALEGEILRIEQNNGSLVLACGKVLSVSSYGYTFPGDQRVYRVVVELSK